MDSISNQNQLHFVLFPYMAQGHLLPMVDIGRLLAQREVVVTIVTTPIHAGRVHKTIAIAMESGLPIRLVQLQFHSKEAGLPDGIETSETLPSEEDLIKFIVAANKMEDAAKKLFETLTPRPSCIISDFTLHYTSKIASEFQVPRISFHGFCCFCLLCRHNIHSSKILERIVSGSEYFTIPGLPGKVEFTKLQVPVIQGEAWKEILEPVDEADRDSYGVVINTFEELESSYVNEYKKVRKDKAWCIGPVSLSHKDELDKTQRGNNYKASISEKLYLNWLDSQAPNSVIYACLGSLFTLELSQLIELGSGLEASNKPFIWILRGDDTSKEIEKWIKEDGFEERTKGRGLVIQGWAPQLLILSHSAIGGFLTHCGWNSIIEAISAGVPLITLPLGADQFCNEKLVVQILKIGISLETPWVLGEKDHKSGIVLKKENVKCAVGKLLDEGKEASERRKRAKEFGEKAKKAVEVGGSSYLNMTLLIQDIRQQSNKTIGTEVS